MKSNLTLEQKDEVGHCDGEIEADKSKKRPSSKKAIQEMRRRKRKRRELDWIQMNIHEIQIQRHEIHRNHYEFHKDLISESRLPFDEMKMKMKMKMKMNPLNQMN